MTSDCFDEFEQELAKSGVDAAFGRLAARLKREQAYHQLFDVLLMQARRRLGLPVVNMAAIDDLAEPQRSALEDSYIAACREIGQLFLAGGQLRDAWMYLRPTGDRETMATALARFPSPDENVDQIVEIALHEGLAPELGYRLVLSHFGTCNAITMFDSVAHGRSRVVQATLAGLLIRHVQHELLASLRADIERREDAPPPELSVAELLPGRDWLFSEMNYHLDTSHLAAATRIARLVEEPEVLRLAVDLTDYGRRLDPRYQYAGEEPFKDLYASSGLFFRAQLGDDVDQAVDYFRERATALDPYETGTGPVEVFVALLVRLGRYADALAALIELLPAGVTASGFAPTLMELSALAGDFQAAAGLYRQRGDVVNFAAAMIQPGESASPADR